jgi:uncharacterized membrane protein (Fun14 family)
VVVGSVEVMLVLVELVELVVGSLVVVAAALDVVASVALVVVGSAALALVAVVSAAVVSVAPAATAPMLEPAPEARFAAADMVKGFNMLFVAIVRFEMVGWAGCRETDRIGS